MNEDDRIDGLLRKGLVDVPENFHANVMHQIDALETQVESAQVHTESKWYEWLALLVGSTLGLMQVARFVFGAWLLTAAS